MLNGPIYYPVYCINILHLFDFFSCRNSYDFVSLTDMFCAAFVVPLHIIYNVPGSSAFLTPFIHVYCPGLKKIRKEIENPRHNGFGGEHGIWYI